MAIGLSTIESANPLPLFVMKDGIPDWNQLLKLVKEWQPNLFLVNYYGSSACSTGFDDWDVEKALVMLEVRMSVWMDC